MTFLVDAASSEPMATGRRVGLWRAVLHTGEGRIGLALTVFMLAVIVFGRLLAPGTEYAAGVPGSGSSAAHLFGTDALGRDILSRFLQGGVTILVIPSIAVSLALVVGGSLGLLSAYSGGWVDMTISKVFDVMLTLPPLLIVLVLIGALGTSNAILVTTVAVVYCPPFGRVVRGTAQSIMANQYVVSAQAQGERSAPIIFREILPNISGPVLTEVGLRLTYGILFVATLSFLGLGVQPPAPDWGVMVAENRGLLTVAPWASLLPALGIAGLSIGFNLVADALSKCLAGDDRGMAVI